MNLVTISGFCFCMSGFGRFEACANGPFISIHLGKAGEATVTIKTDELLRVESY